MIISGIGSVYLSVPIKGIAKAVKLLLKTLHIVLGDDLGMNMILYRIVLGRETESIPSHRI